MVNRINESVNFVDFREKKEKKKKSVNFARDFNLFLLYINECELN